MNVYDFDNTIFRGDSTASFVMYCYVHDPRTWISIPRTAGCGILYLLHLMPKRTFKENLYHMFVYLKDREQMLDAFAADYSDHIKQWYLDQQQADDLVISASPEFLIRKMCSTCNISNVMASRVDFPTGRYTGENCHGAEKVRRYRERYAAENIDEFYSDSRSDEPLAKIAKRAFLVHGDERKAWPL